jgi:hypothetical protein
MCLRLLHDSRAYECDIFRPLPSIVIPWLPAATAALYPYRALARVAVHFPCTLFFSARLLVSSVSLILCIMSLFHGNLRLLCLLLHIQSIGFPLAHCQVCLPVPTFHGFLCLVVFFYPDCCVCFLIVGNSRLPNHTELCLPLTGFIPVHISFNEETLMIE